MALGLKGKVALVTGGSQGIGKAAALRLAQEGARVAASYVTGTSINLDGGASGVL